LTPCAVVLSSDGGDSVKGEEFVDSVWYEDRPRRTKNRVNVDIKMSIDDLCGWLKHQLGCGDGRSTLDR
jgi:hypothetical protein